MSNIYSSIIPLGQRLANQRQQDFENQLRLEQLQMQQQGMNRPVQDPASVREFMYFQNLAPEQQKQYMGLKRSTPEDTLMAKGMQYNPETGTVAPIGGFVQSRQDIKYGEGLGGELAKAQLADQIAKMQAQGRLKEELKYSPEITKQVELAKVEAGKIGKAEDIIDTSQGLLDAIKEVETHPGLSAVIGMPEITKGEIPIYGSFRSTPAANFKASLKRLRGKTFKKAFETLKGGGQITEKEGEAARDAELVMDTAQTEEQFIKALREYKSIIQKGLERAKQQQGKKTTASTPNNEQIIDWRDY